MIQPRTLKGFRDLTPAEATRRANLVRAVEDVFRVHGFAPIDTPAMEYAEILLGKGGEDSDKELFSWTDKGGRQVALRFDLTVPLARYVAEHQGQLVFPFRRYHVGPVWRGERPQRGRFREFWQCDADIIGTTAPAADAEVLMVMLAAYEALDVGAVTIRVNDRRVLIGLLEHLGVSGLDTEVLRALDKRDKQGADAVAAALGNLGIADEASGTLLALTGPEGTNDEILGVLGGIDNDTVRAGIERLETVRALVVAARGHDSGLAVDPSIARGLDYYTGIVFEAQLDALPAIGSVGSGGRYDDLAGLYTKTRLPGVGCSIGIDRLLAALDALGAGDDAADAPRVMVANPGAERLPAAFAFAAALRRAGVSAEVFPDDAKHGKQMRYADRRGIAFVFTLDDDGALHGKRLADGETKRCEHVEAALSWLE